MPHFIIDCSENILEQHSPEVILRAVYDRAEASGLFAAGDIKVRINPYEHFLLGKNNEAFLHVFGYIMQGRTTEQKAALSRAIIQKLNELFPQLAILSMNITEFESATYCNKSLIHPDNAEGNRHYLL